MTTQLIDEHEFRRLADVVMAASTADHTIVSLNDSDGGTTRFANNQIVQNVNARRYALSVSVAFGHKSGSAGTNVLSDGAIRDTVAQAEKIAKLAPEDPEYLSPLEQQHYPVLPTRRAETADASPERRIELAAGAVRQCRAAGINGAGIVDAYTSAAGVAASSGLFAYEQRTRATFSLTATAEDSTGWVRNANRSIDDLGVDERTRVAIEKAKASAGPTEIPAGKYTVILEPAAVAGLIGPLFRAARAKSVEHGTSPLSGKLGEEIIDPRLTLKNHPEHPSLLAGTFDSRGVATDFRTWIRGGVLEQLNYDRFTAKQEGVPLNGPLNAPRLSGDGAADSTDALVRSTERGVLVTNFWYIRSSNPRDLTLTGMTRDGTFLIEDGKLSGGLINFRFHESPLRAFNQVEAFTEPMDAITMERGKMMLPAMKIRDFNFSSVTRF